MTIDITYLQIRTVNSLDISEGGGRMISIKQYHFLATVTTKLNAFISGHEILKNFQILLCHYKQISS